MSQLTGTHVNLPPKKNVSVFGNSVPASLAVELGAEEGWEMWKSESARGERQYAPTAPMPLAGTASQGAYDPTQPAALSSTPSPTPVPRQAAAPTFDQVMTEARRNNRVCPKPANWVQLYALLEQCRPQGTAMPTPPLVDAAWNLTPNLAKRMALREHLEWADRVGQLGNVRDFLQALKEDDWHHMGD